MKINLDDPNLTAFALGELSGAEQAAMEQAVSSSAEAQSFVAKTQQLAHFGKPLEATTLECPAIQCGEHPFKGVMGRNAMR